jgi:hypothetical protein
MEKSGLRPLEDGENRRRPLPLDINRHTDLVMKELAKEQRIEIRGR